MVSEECNFLFIPTLSAAMTLLIPTLPYAHSEELPLTRMLYFCQVRTQLLRMGWGIHEVAAVCV